MDLWHLNTLLQEVSSSDHSVCEEVPKVLYLQNTLHFGRRADLRLDVRISGTLVDHVTQLFAASTSHILELLLLRLLVGVLFVFFFVILALMLRELAAWLVFTSLAAAPPHLSAVIVLMGPAAPVEVLFLKVLFAALLAHLYIFIHFALLALILLNSLFKLVVLLYVLLALLFGFDDGFLLGPLGLLQLIDLLIQVAHDLLVVKHSCCLLALEFDLEVADVL